MDNNIFFCKPYIYKPIYIINSQTDKYVFIKSNIKTEKLINKIGDKGIDKLSNNDIEELIKYYPLLNDKEYILDTFKDCIIIDDWLNQDDSIIMTLHKIGKYCCKYKVTGESIYAWTINDGKYVPIAFEYDKDIETPFWDLGLIDKNIDYDFVNDKGISKLINTIFKYNNLLEEASIKDNTIYFIDSIEIKKIYNISTKIKYDESNWPRNLPSINLFINGLFKKYWPKLDDKYIKNTYTSIEYKSIEDSIQNIYTIIKKSKYQLSLIEDSFNSIPINNTIKESIDHLDCDSFLFKVMKLSNSKLSNSNSINIVKLFADFKLNETYPLTKLVLDTYDRSYYKLYKSSIKKGVTKGLCTKWIKDYMVRTVDGIQKYIYSNNVFIVKIFMKKDLYISLIIHSNGCIDIIIDNYFTIDISKDDINNIINKSNQFIKDIINTDKIYSNKREVINYLDYKIDYSYDTMYNYISFFDCIIGFDINQFKNNKGQIIYDSNMIINLFKNFYSYTRIIEEKQLVLTDNNIYAIYKRVSNYDRMDTLTTLISTLKNPELNINDETICTILSESLNITIEEASQEISNWTESIRGRLIDGKKVYTLSTSEPGVEIIIKRDPTLITVDLNGVKSINELHRICIFIKKLS